MKMLAGAKMKTGIVEDKFYQLPNFADAWQSF
jgi:hypothetical protein